MNHLVEIEAFVAVVDEGSFAAAGDRLGVSSSYVSKLVTGLEQRLGVQLLRRTTRQHSLTEPGRRLYESCRGSLADIEAATGAAAQSELEPRGNLRVTLPTGLGAWMSEAMAEFMASHRALSADLVYLDRFVDLVQEGFDVAIRAGSLEDSSMIASRLAVLSRVLVASPALMDRVGPIAEPADLRHHPCLVYSLARAPSTWELLREGETQRVTVSGTICANNGDALTRLAAAGLGIALVPEFYAAPALRAGELRRVLPAWTSEFPVHALYPSSPHVPAKVRALIDFLRDKLKSPPWR